MSNSVRPHRRKPTRPLHPWDSPGKNTRVGCHCLLQCMEVKSEREVAQSCPTLCDPIDGSPPGSPRRRSTSHQSSAGREASAVQVSGPPHRSVCAVRARTEPASRPLHQAPLSLGFSRQEHWSGLPLPSPMHESEKVKVKLLSHV